MKTTTIKPIYRILLFIFIGFLPSCEGIDKEDINNDEIITLRILDVDGVNEIIDNEAIGNGDIIITLEASIDPSAENDFRTVTFETSMGTFFSSNPNSIQKVVDVNGIAQVKLRLPLSDDLLTVSAKISKGSNTYFDESSISLIGVDQVVSLSVLDEMQQDLTEIIRADGVTTLFLKATVHVNKDQLNTVTFNTSSNAMFLSSNAQEAIRNTDEDGVALVPLKVSVNVGPVFFSSKVGSTTQYLDEENIILERAYPDELYIEPQMVVMNTTNPNQIKAILVRNVGQVSLETSATFKAFQTISGVEVEVGRFTGLANVSNAQGEITVNFYADTGIIDPLLPVTIRITSLNDDLISISNITTLMIN